MFNELEKLIHIEGNERSFLYKDWNCKVIRRNGGYLCGYVKMPDDSLFCRKDYDSDPLCNLQVHGGLTYADELVNEDGWWIGFDCAHHGDMIPYFNDHIGQYRDMKYVVQELKNLVHQLILLEEENRC